MCRDRDEKITENTSKNLNRFIDLWFLLNYFFNSYLNVIKYLLAIDYLEFETSEIII